MTRKQWRLIESSAVLLFTFQAIRVLFSMLFGQIYDALFDGESYWLLAASGALILAMILMPLLSPRDDQRVENSLRIAAVLCSIARAPLSIDFPLVRMVSATLTLGFSGLYVTGLLRSRASTLPLAMSISLIVDILLRTLGHTFDLSLRPWWGLVQVALSLSIIYLAEWLLKHDPEQEPLDAAGTRSGIAYGASLFLLSSLFALPQASARWTGSSYALTVAWTMLAATLPLWPAVRRWIANGPLSRTRWARVLALALVLTSLILASSSQSAWATLALVEGIAAFWLLLPLNLHQGRQGTGRGVILGMLLLLLLGTSHALSYTYAYVSALLKGVGLPTFLVSALLASGLVLWPRSLKMPITDLLLVSPGRIWLISGVVCWLVALLFALPRAPQTLSSAPSVKLATYNIHYGYDSHWHLALERQARAIAASKADIIALQEVDAGRLTSFGIDNAYWLGRRLGMQVVYLPTVEHTTGIAMLSRLAINDNAGMSLPSNEEPTGMIRINVTVGGAALQAHGVWLGLSSEERAQQLDAALASITSGVASLAGDMNATPDSVVYRQLVAKGFIDPFVLLDVDTPPTSPSESPVERIDYVWIRGLQPTDARVSDSLASDHRLVVIAAQ